MSATDLRSSGDLTGVKVSYPVDFWLYDTRVTLDFKSDAFAAAWPHPAVVAQQAARWPSGGLIYSYRHLNPKPEPNPNPNPNPNPTLTLILTRSWAWPSCTSTWRRGAAGSIW